VNTGTQTVSFSTPATQTYLKGKTFTLSATDTGGGAITYTSSNPTVISISGSKATIQGVGSASITASVAASPNYAAATATQTVTVH
jgi:uncharacterized protein YjdB